MTKKSRIFGLLTILLVFCYGLVSFIPLVSSDDLSGSSLTASPTTIRSLQNSTITVTVMNATSDPIEGANVGISAEGGEFTDGSTIYNETTDVSGIVEAEWRAPLVDYDTYYNFTAIIKKTSSTNITLTTQVLVEPLDLSLSSISADPQEINERESSEITVVAEGIDGVVEGANVQLDGVGGNFSSSGTDQSFGVTDTSGEYSDTWNAPEVTDITNYTIVLTLTYTGTNVSFTDELNITVNPIEGQLGLDITVSPGYNLEVGETVTIDLIVLDTITTLPVENAYVSFSAIDGNFTESGLDSYADYTNAQGEITVHWETDTLDPGMFGTTYEIDITATKLGLLTNETTLEFNVTEEIGTPLIDVQSDASTINLGESVNITVTVTVDGSPYEGAVVEILAQDGEFTQSESTEIERITNADGIVEVTWDTANMIMTGSDPLNYTFTITVDIFPYYLDQEANLTISVAPPTTSPTDTQPSQFYTEWWFFVAVGGGIIGIGLLIIFFRKK